MCARPAPSFVWTSGVPHLFSVCQAVICRRRATQSSRQSVCYRSQLLYFQPHLGSFLQKMANLTSVLSKFYHEYTSHTSKRLKIIDSYLLYVLLTGIIQFVYCCLVGTFPFNSFLSGFISTVSCFVLGVCLRLQVNPENKSQFYSVSPERAFADFIFAHVILHLVVMNFIG